MNDQNSDKVRLEHIMDAIVEIEKYTNGITKEEFMNNSMMRHACAKQLENIGEAVAR